VGGIIAIVVAVLAVFLVMYHGGGVAITPLRGTHSGNLEEYFGSPVVSQVGTGTMCTLPNGTVKVVFTLNSNANVQIIGITIEGYGLQVYGVMKALTPGINHVTIYLPNTSGYTFQPGSIYVLILGLSDRATVQVAVTYVGQC
jgi:hypothetical protein